MKQEQFQSIAFKTSKLAEHFDCFPDEISTSPHNDQIFEYGREEYYVLTDEEADELAREYILDTVYAFNSDFLAGHLKKGVSVEVLKCLQKNDLCEENNVAILSLIEDIDHFVNDAILADGRGHFLASYDGDEIELNQGYYAYRIN